MRKHSTAATYIVASILCIAGILLAVAGEVRDGYTPFGPKLGSSANADPSQSPVQAGVNMGEQLSDVTKTGKIAADTSIFWVMRYTKCGHDKVRELAPDPGMIGKTLEEFAKAYPEYTLEMMGTSVRMVRVIDQYCPDHYIIKSDDDGGIYVYRNMEGLTKLTMVTKMNFTVDSVPQDYRPLLKEGMAFGSIEEIEGLIEDAET
jgi:hypothetical protein